MKNRWVAWGMCIFLAGVLVAGSSRPFWPIRADGQTAASVQLISSTDAGVVLAWTLPGVELKEIDAEGQRFVRVDMAGLLPGAEPGSPMLPRTGVLIGVPPESSPTLRVLESEQEVVPLAHPVYPAPLPLPSRAADGVPVSGVAYALEPDGAIYGQNAFYPRQVVQVGDVGLVGDRRVAQVRFHPVRYNPARDELEVTRRLVVGISFNAAADVVDQSDLAARRSSLTSPIFQDVLGSSLINGRTAQGWRSESLPVRAAALASASFNEPATHAGSYKVLVDAEGIYQLTYARLQAAGVPVAALDPRTVQLFDRGEEVSIQVVGQEDGHLDPGDYVLFYGDVPPSRYVAHHVYWLRYGDEIGLRMGTRDVVPGGQAPGTAWTTARFSENRYYDPLFAAVDGDHWYAADLRPQQGYTATLELMSLATGVPTATLQAWLVGYTGSGSVNPDHRVSLALNGRPVGESAWDGQAAATLTLTVDRSLLRQGNNQVSFTLPGTGAPVEGAWLDAVEIDYPMRGAAGDQIRFWGQAGAHRYELSGFGGGDIRLYDVTDAGYPTPLLQGAIVPDGGSYKLTFADAPVTGRVYVALTASHFRQPVSVVADVPSNLHSLSNGADYILVTHASFMGAVQPLAAYRQAQGLRVSVVDVQDVYDEFSGGMLDPEAIRALIGYAYAHWQPPVPTYVLLVGDGSYDFLDHMGYGSANYVPPYLAMVDPWWGETAADNLYAAVSGSDPLPDVLLGRMPVNTVAEAQVVVGKILGYEQSPWLGDWNARHVFVADDRDTAGDFASSADRVYDRYVDDLWVGARIYLDTLSEQVARQEILSAWDRGALLFSFVGHSSWHQWTHEAVFHIGDVSGLHNGRQLPVLLSMTCFTGFFHHPEYATLDESLFRLPGGGAVATWSPSGLGINAGHGHLHEGFYRAVFDQGATQLGQAILSAKLYLYGQAPVYAELLDTYHLFGDPAMSLNLTLRPWPYSLYLPQVDKAY